jgi:uroporphyrinogen III methyltransferase/synthase
MPKPKVYLVGAGPGDAELITLKGFRLIAAADVILYDRLVPRELLKLAKPQAEIISVAKSADRHEIPQEKINSLIIEKAKQNKIVLRLKGGDPLLFGRGAEESMACVEAGIDFEIVPGVTSALAAPAYAGIPPTHRDFTSSLAIVTGHRQLDKPLEIPKAGTIIFLMGVANLQQIVSSLINAGFPPSSKIAAIENGACYNQKTVIATLDNIVSQVQQQNLKPPVVFVVGKVVDLHEKLNWFDKKPNVLVIGLHPEKYSSLGNIVHRQIIDCVPIDDYSTIDKTLKRLDNFDWLVFTSANGIKFFFQRLNALGLDARALAGLKIAVMGKTSAESLESFGVLADLVPETESSAGLLEKFKEIDVKNKKFLLPQSRLASAELPDGLADMGARVEQLTIYDTIEIDPGPIDFAHIDRILFTSGSTIRAFVKRYGRPAPHIECLCLGPPSQAEAKKLGIDAIIFNKND